MKLCHWYLPLSRESTDTLACCAVLEPQDFSHFETAAILYLHQLPRLSLKSSSPLELERAFAGLLNYTPEKLASVLSQNYNQNSLKSGLDLMPSLGIGLMSQETIRRQPFLRQDNSWDFDYAQKHNKTESAITHKYMRPNGSIARLSDPQLRLIETIRANQKDSIETQALAGTGKTFVLGEILTIMESYKCLFIADTDAKLQAVRSRFPKKAIATMTFKQIAEKALSRGNRQLENSLINASRLPLSYPNIAEQLELTTIGNRSHAQVAALCWAMVFRFCNTDSRLVTTKHIPKDQIKWLTPLEQEAAAAAANKLWTRINLFEIEAQALPVRGYHRLKQMALFGLHIPDNFQTVIIDEGHDLTAPMVSILDRSPQTVITLGDQFQNLGGSYVTHKATIRHREMSTSLRAGPELSDYINPLIEAYPESLAQPFSADRSKETLIQPYAANEFPPEPSVIIAADEWGLFDWLIKNRQQKMGAAVLDWDMSFERFPQECLDLFLHNKKPAHGAIARFKSWENLHSAMKWNHAFIRVEKWLESIGRIYGASSLYQRAELTEILKGAPSRPLLATVFTTKNFELPRITISEDLYYFSDLSSKRDLSKKLATLYTAITRAREKIYIPETHQDWIKHILDSGYKPR